MQNSFSSLFVLSLVCVSRCGGNWNEVHSKAFTMSRFVRGECSFSLMFYDLALDYFLYKVKEKKVSYTELRYKVLLSVIYLPVIQTLNITSNSVSIVYHLTSLPEWTESYKKPDV